MSSHTARAAQLAALAARIEGAPPGVQALLRDKLAEGRAALAQTQTPPTAPVLPIAVREPKKARGAGGPLALLARHAAEGAAGSELASAVRFRRSWSRSRAAERVVQASSSKPLQAGPLNSQVLMLESLELMRQLSPDYLRRFVAHAETLLWLEEAAGPPRAARAATPSRKR